MNQEKASIAMEAAIAESEKLGAKTNISIVDAGGILVAFERMDGAWLGSIDISMKRAKTAILFDMPTRDLGKKVCTYKDVSKWCGQIGFDTILRQFLVQNWGFDKKIKVSYVSKS